MTLAEEEATWYLDHMPAGVQGAFGRTVYSQTAVVNKTGAVATEQSLVSSGAGSATLANLAVGEIVRIHGTGRIARDAGTATFRWRMKLGATTVLDDGGGVAAYNSTAGMIEVSAEIVVLATGVSGSVRPQGVVRAGSAAGGAFHYGMWTTAPVAVDLSEPRAFDFTVLITGGDAGEVIEMTSLTIERIKAA